MSIDLSSLNDAQKKAVMDTQGPCLVIAGPGSGKTRVLTYRIAYLVRAQQIPPYRIMVLTFTKKAAEEMKKRLENILGEPANQFWIGTFHSVFGKILRIEAEAIGFSSDFSIYDTNDSKSLLKKIIKELNLDSKMYLPNKLLRRISKAKQFFMSAADYTNHKIWKEEDKRRKLENLHQVYTYYERRCRAANAMDFDDLLFLTYQLFRDREDILHKYQQRFDYLLVDEFQDTDPVQYHIIKSLAAEHKNLCVVGDDAQSIYAFRGAEVKHILSFCHTFSNAKKYKLQQNYRSTQQILQAANALIQHNKGQHRKALFTTNEIGAPVEIISANDSMAEAYTVIDELITKANKKELAVDYNDFAILYRTNHQSRLLEEILIKKDIPYQIIGNISFFQRKEIKDVLAYLQLIVNPQNEEALMRAINQPKRNIGPKTLEKIYQYAKEKGCSVWEAITKIKEWMSVQVAEKIAQFAQLINGQRALLAQENAHTIAKQTIVASGLKKLFQADLSLDQTPRYEYVEELLNSLQNFVATHGEEATLTLFLEEIALMTHHDTKDNPNQPRVKLMTAHKAKGLEFPYVYIIGMEEDIFPSSFSVGTAKELEEERRLFFVAITRAQRELMISYADHHYQNQEITATTPSRFLKELNVNGPHLYKTQSKPSWSSVLNPNTPEAKSYRPAGYPAPRQRSYRNQKGFSIAEISAFKIGQYVIHPVFGEGIIQALDGTGDHKKAIVQFLQGGSKTLMLRFAKLMLK
ncbi:MAG: UvrD-helicase domain-containing protein [Bacteroidota bacterium]